MASSVDLPDQYNNLIFIGTHHISDKSKDAITRAFATHNPSTVAIELDPDRLQQLRTRQRTKPSLALARRVGFTGYIFAVFTHTVQGWLGNKLNILPGQELLHAHSLAEQHAKNTLLIVKPRQEMLKAVTQIIGWREKVRMIQDFLLAPFTSNKVEIQDVPNEQLLHELIERVKKRYPGFYDALIAQRDKYMAKKIFQHVRHAPDEKILIVTGAAHTNGIKKRLATLHYANPSI